MFYVPTASSKFAIYPSAPKTPIPSNKAVAKIRELIKLKHTKFKRISFSRLYLEEDSWILYGDVEYTQAFFFTSQKFFKAKINISTGVVTYSEMYLQEDKQKTADNLSGVI